MDARELCDFENEICDWDVREKLDLCQYRDAEIALLGYIPTFQDDSASIKTKFVHCDDCGTWSAGHERECPYCFTKWGA